MKKTYLSFLAIGISSLLLVSGNAWAAHYLNHYQGPNAQEPTPSQISEFCQGYSKLKPDTQLNQKEQYEKYCKKSLAEPITKKPLITRLTIKGKCVTAKDEVQILGRDFGEKGTVLLRLNGKETAQKIRRWTATSILIALNGKLRPGNRYPLTVKTATGISNQKSLLLCKEKTTSATISQPAPIAKKPTPGLAGKNGIGQAVSFDKTDLVVKVTGPQKVTAGVSIPGLRVEAKNIGKVQASGYKIDLILSKDNQAQYRLNRLSLKSKTGTPLLQTLSLTTPLAPNGRKDYFPNIRLPANTAAGQYYLCAIIDSANKLNEYKENNNTQCKQIQVAAAKKIAPVMGELGSKLRENINYQRQPISKIKPTSFEKPTPPTNIQTTELFINSLTINGSLLATVDVADGGTANVAWTFPADSSVDWTYLRIKEGTFSGSCPTGVSNRAGRTDLEGRDTGWEAFPDRQNYRVSMGNVTIDLGAGRGFVPGRSYSIQACGLVPPTGGAGREYAHESNVVVLRYANAATTMHEPTPEETIEIAAEPIPGLIPEAIHSIPSRLTVNFDPWSRNVDVGTSAEVRWSFRSSSEGGESEVRKVYLRIARDFIGQRNLSNINSRGLCPAPGVSLEAGLAQINEWDSRYLDLPGRGFYGSPVSGSSGSIAITPGGEYDLNQYNPNGSANSRDYKFTFVACGLIQPVGGSDGLVFAHETNPVWITMVDIPTVPRLIYSPYDLTIEDIVKVGRKTLVVAKITLPVGYTFPESVGLNDLRRRIPTIKLTLRDVATRDVLTSTTKDSRVWTQKSAYEWKTWILLNYGVPNGYRQRLLAELTTFRWRDADTLNNWLDKTIGSGAIYHKTPDVRDTRPTPPGPPKGRSELEGFRETLRSGNRLDFEFTLINSGKSKELRIEVERNPLAKMVCRARDIFTDYRTIIRISNSAYSSSTTAYSPRARSFRVSCVEPIFYTAGSGEGRIFIRAFDDHRINGANINSPVDEIVVDFNVTRPSP